MRRAAISIGSNLAEGRGRRGDPEFARFLQIALGSAYELRYQWLVAKDVGYLSPDDQKPVYDLLDEVCAMLWSLIERTKGAKPTKE
jgi:four helix bundle protein